MFQTNQSYIFLNKMLKKIKKIPHRNLPEFERAKYPEDKIMMFHPNFNEFIF